MEYKDKDAIERKWHEDEFKKLDSLRLEHARLGSKVDFLEKEVVEAKRNSDSRFAKLESKIDELSDSIQGIKNDVKEAIIKIGFITVIGLMVIQVIAKHFGFL